MGTGKEDGIVGFRLRFRKFGNARFLSHRDLIRTFERALRRSGLRPAITRGFNPRTRIILRPAVALGAAIHAAALDVFLEENPGAESLAALLAVKLPPGLDIVGSAVLPSRKPAPIAGVTWLFSASEPLEVPDDALLPPGFSASKREDGSLLIEVRAQEGREPPGLKAVARALGLDDASPDPAWRAEMFSVEFEDGI